MALPAPPPTRRPPLPLGTLLLTFLAVFLLFNLLGTAAHLQDTTNTNSTSRLHPVAMLKALKYASLADGIGKGVPRDVDVTLAIRQSPGLTGLAIVDNLGHISGSPRVVQYNVRTLGTWVRVCVDIPVSRKHHPYALICPSNATTTR